MALWMFVYDEEMIWFGMYFSYISKSPFSECNCFLASQKLLHFMEPESSSLFSQKPAWCLCVATWIQSTFSNLSIKIHFNIWSTSRSSWVVCVTPTIVLYTFLLAHMCHVPSYLMLRLIILTVFVKNGKSWHPYYAGFSSLLLLLTLPDWAPYYRYYYYNPVFHYG